MPGIDNFTKLMLHMDGEDAATTFTDDSPTPHTVTEKGQAQIDTAQSVFGEASGLFDGAGDYLEIPDHADFAFGGGDFTIDFRVRFNSLPTSGGFMAFYSRDLDIAEQDVFVDLWNDTGTYKLRIAPYFSDTPATISETWTTPVVDTWYHLAFVRHGDNWKIFVDGIQLGSDTVQAGTLDASTSLVTIGRWVVATPRELDGWFDEFRVSKGIARWTGNFTKPTEAYSADGSNITLPQLTVQGGGAATGNITLPQFTVVVAGGPGIVEITLPQFTVVALGPANASFTLPGMTAQGSQDYHGSSDITLPSLELDAFLLTGGVFGTTINLPRFNLTIEAGKLIDLLLPGLDITGVGFQGEFGILDKSLARLVITGVGTQHNKGDFNISLPQFTLDTNFLSGVLGTLNTNLASLSMFARGFRGESGDADITLPSLTMNNTGYHSLGGTVDKSLNMLTVEAYGDVYTNRIV